MNQLFACSHFSPKYHIADQGGFRAVIQSKERRIHHIPNACQIKRAINPCDQRVSASIIRNGQINNNRSCELFERHRRIPASLQDGCASASDHEDDCTTSLKDVLRQKLFTLYRFMSLYVVIGKIIGITAMSMLAVENVTDLTPAFFVELLKAVVPSVLMDIYMAGINDLSDVEIDKINKPHRPLASGELSKGTATAVVYTSLLMSLAMGIMFKSPPQIIALLIYGAAGTVYSVDLPFMRWKKNPFLAAICMYSLGLTNLLFFIHAQKYVLGKPIVITRSFMFATAFIIIFSAVFSLSKDISDVDGDREHGIQTFSIRLGKERVFWLCVQLLLIACGAAVIFGVLSSSFLPSKLVTIVGHMIIAYILWLRARSTDLSCNASLKSFYMFLWKLSYAEYLLLPFAR